MHVHIGDEVEEQVFCSQGVTQEDVREVGQKLRPDGAQLAQETGYNWTNKRKTFSI